MQIDKGIFDKSCCGLPNRNDGLADSNDRMGFSKQGLVVECGLFFVLAPLAPFWPF